MISPEQMRAARGLLGWTQTDLVKICGLSKTSVNNIERGLVKARSSTLDTIQRKFEERGVEFSGDYGVNLKKEIFNVETYDGDDAMGRYLQDVIATLKGTNLEAIHSNVDDQLLVDMGYGPDLQHYYEDMMRYGLRERVLVCDGDMKRYGPYETSQYRWISKELYSQTGYSLYGNKYTIFSFEPVTRIIVIESPLIADIQRKQFSANWAVAKPQPKVSPLFQS